jgi:D-amino-acid dehydrogenase
LAGSPDVVVVGGGAIGVSIAYELGRRGAAVRLVDREPIGSPASASAGNAGLVCPSHALPLANPRALREGLVWAFKRDSPLRIRPRPSLVPWLLRFALAARPANVRRGHDALRALSIRSLHLHARLAAAGIDTSFQRRGIANVYETKELFDVGDRERREAAEEGLDAETLDAGAARKLAPALTGPIAGAVVYSSEGHCDPRRYVAAVAEAARESGVEILGETEVRSLRTCGRRVTGIETRDGALDAGEVVVAAGAWSAQLVRSLGLRIPIAPAKGYHVDLVSAAARAVPLPLFLQEARVVVTPFKDRLRLAGTLDFAGFDLRIDGRRVDGLRRAAERALPGIAAARAVATWAGLRPCTPDGLPVIGRSGDWESLTLATGHGMLGLTLAPVTGELVGALLLGGATSKVTALTPDRFGRTWREPGASRRRTSHRDGRADRLAG